MIELTELTGLDNWRTIKPVKPEHWQDLQRMKPDETKPVQAYSPALDFDAEEPN